MFDHLTLEKQFSVLDHPSPSPGIALARAVDAVLALCSPGAAQRVALSGCGLDRVQIGPVLVGSTVELDLSWNPLSEIDSLPTGTRASLTPRACCRLAKRRRQEQYDSAGPMCVYLFYPE